MKKKTSRREFVIQRKLYNAFPRYIPRPISYRDGILTSKNSGVSLKTWLNTHRYTDDTVLKIVRNVYIILKKITKRFPKFRHMDLHLDNILVNNRGRIIIIDFGISKFTSGRKGYDFHFFLNSMRHYLMSQRTCNCKKTRALVCINSMLKRGMRGSNNIYVKNFRLRPGVSFNPSESASSIAKKLLGFRA